MQNTSHAVMAQRIESQDELDDFPTPPWATRALMEQFIGPGTQKMTCLEPACNRGYMVKPLREYFGSVDACDIHDYGYGYDVQDFMNTQGSWDWIITNPPFKAGERFIHHALSMARRGCAFFARTTFIESIGRYERLYMNTPPAIFAQFVERVPIVKGRVDRNASTATGYCWLIWLKNSSHTDPALKWVKPCRRNLERDEDYDEPLPNH